MDASTHIISRQRIRFRYNGTADAFALRQLVSSICSEELPARLNVLLDRYDAKDQVLLIDRLNVQVALSDTGSLRETLAKAIIEHVETALRAKLAGAQPEALSIDTSFARALLFYLERGFLPWWSLSQGRLALVESFRSSRQSGSLSEVARSILPSLKKRHARQRLERLLDEELFDDFLEATGVWSSGEWADWKASLKTIARMPDQRSATRRIESELRLALLEALSGAPTVSAASKRLATQLFTALKEHGLAVNPGVLAALPRSVQEGFREQAERLGAYELSPGLTTDVQTEPATAKANDAQRDDAEPARPPEDGDSMVIRNAGLVLVALYLPPFFKNLGLMEDGVPRDLDRAISILHYLVFEDEVFEELDVVLEKILCGAALEEGIAREHCITEEEGAQTSTLLQSVIEHWTALKNTTPAGLRHNFLQREGRLVFRSNHWELTVQKQAQDILLDYLPWNISMIRLAWMKHMLVVKWS